MEGHAGQAWVGICVRLRQPLHIPPQRNYKNNPNRKCRRARRAAARQQEGAEEAYHVAEQENTDEAVEAEQSVVSLDSANDTDIQNTVAEEASNLEINVSVEDKLEGSSVDLPCIFCDFRSNWANGVKIHIGESMLI